MIYSGHSCQKVKTINIIVYNKIKTTAMRDANIVFNYCRKAFPKTKSIVEDYSDAKDMVKLTRISSEKLFILSTVGEEHEECLSVVKAAKDIRNENRYCDIILVVENLETLKLFTNNMLLPTFVFEKEVDEEQLKKYFTTKSAKEHFGNLLDFTSENKKHVINIQEVVCAQAQNKRVLLQTLSNKYNTSLTIASLEKYMPGNFVKVDKGVIVNSDYIKAFDSATEMISLLTGQTFFVSRRGQQRLLHTITRNS